MKGKRIFERFGFNVEKSEIVTINEPQILTDFEELEFNPKVCDWKKVYIDIKLSGYKPSSQLAAILENNINTAIE